MTDTTTSPAGRLGARERAVLERLLPGLDEKLAAHPLAELEKRGGPAIPAFREAGGAGLLVPTEHNGLGADPLEGIRVQRALAMRSPSLAVAAMMHHLSLASFTEYLTAHCAPDAFEWILLKTIAGENQLVASASAEARRGGSMLEPTMRARRDGSNFMISGSKKPCSLSQSMDWFTASVLVEGDEKYDGHLAMAVVPAATEGLVRRPFWESEVLAGAESDEVVLEDLVLDESLMVFTDQKPGSRMDILQIRGWTWFELLAAASYVGVAGLLVEKVMASPRVSRAELGALLVKLESAMGAVENVARDMAGSMDDPGGQMAHSLLARFHVQETVMEVSTTAAELAGGISFIRDTEVGYLLQATRALAFHPPARAKALPALAGYFLGEDLDTTVY
ncbi:acyl-CoA dehydrogenase family protein [Streptomyces sparsogenes]|uniref:Isobutylamine N-hydroxylase n=1 Tax=Streptomyces sparsogenes DSM 40356 TaxID=1331668 RepID=A0A1R1SI53_9ACTN|nr:acyl-CoA dehydrogenase family protein [Streptomyces sparsogenes]OMI37916.1 isobutylamine N-hydroxylase [Streptomyces sparsogenes DSM 40356]